MNALSDMSGSGSDLTAFTRKQRLVSLFGQKRFLSPHDLWQLTASPYTILFLAIAVATLTVSDANAYQSDIHILAVGFVWLACIAIITICYFATILGWGWINFKMGKSVVLMPVVAFIGSGVTLIAAEAMVSLFASSHPLDFAHVLWLFPQTFVLVLLFDSLYFSFAIPAIRSQIQPETSTVGQKKSIRLAGRTFPASDILYASAHDHYLQLQTASGSQMVLARMSDLAEQMKGRGGIQPHRSWWVQPKAVEKLEKQGTKDVLRLIDGTLVPVPRARLKELTVWIDQIPDEDA